MAEQRAKKQKTQMKECLAIVTESGEEVVLDDEIARKYHLKAGVLSPFSSQPIISVVREVPVVAPKPGGDGAPAAKGPSRKKAVARPKAKKNRPKGKKTGGKKR